MQASLQDYVKWSDEADFVGQEGVLYCCDATKQLNEDVGDLEQRILALEVCCMPCHGALPRLLAVWCNEAAGNIFTLKLLHHLTFLDEPAVNEVFMCAT
jgi:hypothetical protein